MTDQIDGKAVERGVEWLREIDMHDEAAAVTALLSERDALQAQVEGLTKERDFENGSRLTSEAQLGVEIDRLMRERDAALAREGAMAMEVRAQYLSCAMQVFNDAGCGCDDAENIAKAIRDLPIPTDAAAALARREDDVIEECAKALEAWGDIYGRSAASAIRALKRSRAAG